MKRFVISFVFMAPILCVVLACKKSATPDPVKPTVASTLVFKGTGFENNGNYPKLYTCDSLGIAPGLQWSGAPSATKSYAITMHHFPPTGDKHVYWVVYNIPSTVNAVPENTTSGYGFGINTVNGKNIYTPPCSQGPGPKVYILTLYALSANPTISLPASQITMDAFMENIKNIKLDSAVMNVTYTR